MMQAQQKWPGLIERHWLNLLIFGLLALLYVPMLLHWVDGWVNKSISIEHEYFSHGLIGIPFAGYIVWSNRQKWRRLEDRSHPLGLVLLGLGAVFYLTGAMEWVNFSFPLVLAGICLALKGMPGLRLSGFALLFVALSTPNPIPYLVAPYTLPLQTFIAGSAGFILMQLGLNTHVEGIYLTTSGRLVEVAPYCAGLKMLFTSFYVSLMLLYWTGMWRSRNKFIALLVGASIISVVANILRNTLLTFFYGTKQDSIFEWLHQGWGGDLYSAMMLGAIVLLQNRLEGFSFQQWLDNMREPIRDSFSSESTLVEEQAVTNPPPDSPPEPLENPSESTLVEEQAVTNPHPDSPPEPLENLSEKNENSDL